MAKVISKEQQTLNAALHQQENFGNREDAAGLAARLPEALNRMHEMGICNSFLDYGTGKGKLVQRLRRELPNTLAVHGYDPAVDAYAQLLNKPVDILTCLDVLEHVEMASIDAVLQEIHRLTLKFCYLVIDLQPAVKTLADGRNAHILLAPSEWWVSRLSQHFPCMANFPIYHKSGHPQKLVIAAAHNPKLLPAMYGFLIKLKIFNHLMVGGVLSNAQAPGA